jgi:hypothetical protein
MEDKRTDNIGFTSTGVQYKYDVAYYKLAADSNTSSIVSGIMSAGGATNAYSPSPSLIPIPDSYYSYHGDGPSFDDENSVVLEIFEVTGDAYEGAKYVRLVDTSTGYENSWSLPGTPTAVPSYEGLSYYGRESIPYTPLSDENDASIGSINNGYYYLLGQDYDTAKTIVTNKYGTELDGDLTVAIINALGSAPNDASGVALITFAYYATYSYTPINGAMLVDLDTGTIEAWR